MSAMPDTIHRRGTRQAVEWEWEKGTCHLVYGHARGLGFGFWGVAK
jgi:hypothetical protein